MIWQQAAGALTCALLFAFTTLSAGAQTCATPGTDGAVATSGIVNAYWPGTSNPGTGTTTLVLGSGRGASTPIATGDLILIMQMQDANINSSNSGSYGDGVGGDPASGSTALRRSGRFEFARAASSVGLGGGTLTLTDPTQFNYGTQAATGTRGQRQFQVVRVPQYATLTLNNTLSALNWNGSSGGVIAVDVAGEFNLNGQTVDASGAGFRGGGARNSTSGSGVNTDYRTPSSNNANGSKGEGIAGTPRLVFDGLSLLDNVIEGYPNGSFARGAPGNAGGGGTDGNPAANDQNTGAGGGGGAGSGGTGGHAWCPGGPAACAQSGGFGGAGTTQGAGLLTLGGGGGAGTTNNATGTPAGGLASSGANGGGLIIVRASQVLGSGTLRVDGDMANQTVGNDGSGGGGGAGSILMVADDASGASVSLTATGGNGGTNGNSSPHGPGGGGGGGFIGLNSALIGASTQFSGGIPGTTDGNPSPFTSNYGATFGNSGSRTTIDALDIPGVPSGYECTVTLEVQKQANIVSDSVHGTTNPHALPGAVVEYAIEITNPASVAVDAGTIMLTDAIPTNAAFLNLPLSSGFAVELMDGVPSSGLSLSATDVSFSNDNGATFGYAPGVGVDSTVTTLRVIPAGSMAAGATATLRFRVEIN
ncbi:MAG: hypothetical protein AB8G16_19095 [Gammaproteobacteria bacterium]